MGRKSAPVFYLWGDLWLFVIIAIIEPSLLQEKEFTLTEETYGKKSFGFAKTAMSRHTLDAMEKKGDH